MNIVLSDYVDPDYGLKHPVEMEFIWATDIASYGLKEQANQLWSRPKRRWPVQWAGIKAAARTRFNEIFNRAAGRFVTFLWSDRDDFACGLTDWSYTAVGAETTTQLAKDYFGDEAETWQENKKAIVPSGTYAPTVKIDGVTKTEGTHFTLDDATGIIDWTAGSAPNGALSAGEVITADYQFYFVVRFESDINRDRLISPTLYRPTFNLLEVVT
jgi:uncharacterized protein (TIGR02217 family)